MFGSTTTENQTKHVSSNRPAPDLSEMSSTKNETKDTTAWLAQLKVHNDFYSAKGTLSESHDNHFQQLKSTYMVVKTECEYVRELQYLQKKRLLK